MSEITVKLYCGDAEQVLSALPDESMDCVITSPPYYALRDYKVEGQIGLEPSVEEYVKRLVRVFDQVWRVLKPTGTVWLNLGDSYAGANSRSSDWLDPNSKQATNRGTHDVLGKHVVCPPGFRRKNLLGIPWRVAFALQERGWYLRSDIIWAKPNPMPESVKDRPTRSHEYIFLLAKSERYYYDWEAIAEPSKLGKTVSCPPSRGRKSQLNAQETYLKAGSWDMSDQRYYPAIHNARSVWWITIEPFPDAHFATFPTKLVERCIAAGCPKDGVVLDPFVGSGTTCLVAKNMGRHSIGIDLNPDYIRMAKERIEADGTLFAQIETII